MEYIDTDNPAVILYHQWRTILEYQRSASVTHLRSKYADKLYNHKTDTGTRADFLEQEMLRDSQWRAGWDATKLDYRMQLTVPALTSAHLDDRLFDDMDDWEPVIRLNLYHGYNGNRDPMMTLWPDGLFCLDSSPATFYQIFPRWTFIRTSYAGGRRVWLPDSPLFTRQHKTGWVWFETNNYNKPIPYVRRHDLMAGEFYRLTPDTTCRGSWRFVAEGHEAAERLDLGYQAAQRRYDRARRKIEDAEKEVRKRNTVSIYVPKQGYLANGDAVKHFSTYLKVHERT